MEQGLRSPFTILVNRTELLSCSMVAGWILQDITEEGEPHFREPGSTEVAQLGCWDGGDTMISLCYSLFWGPVPCRL